MNWKESVLIWLCLLGILASSLLSNVQHNKMINLLTQFDYEEVDCNK